MSPVQAALIARNYDSAETLLASLGPLFPDRLEVQRMKTTIEAERKAAEVQGQTKQFSLRHRHFLGTQ